MWEDAYCKEEKVLHWLAQEVSPDLLKATIFQLEGVREEGHNPVDKRVQIWGEVNLVEVRLKLRFIEIQKSLEQQLTIFKAEVFSLIQKMIEEFSIQLFQHWTY